MFPVAEQPAVDAVPDAGAREAQAQVDQNAALARVLRDVVQQCEEGCPHKDTDPGVGNPSLVGRQISQPASQARAFQPHGRMCAAEPEARRRVTPPNHILLDLVYYGSLKAQVLLPQPGQKLLKTASQDAPSRLVA